MKSKKCLACKKTFYSKNYYGKQWEQTKYCSHKCFGSVDGKRRKTLYKDKTKHPRWLGDKVGYFALHDWVEKMLGKPKKCEVCGLADKRRVYHWANLTTYKRDINDWKRMCVSCHRLYDNKRRRLSYH